MWNLLPLASTYQAKRVENANEKNESYACTRPKTRNDLCHFRFSCSWNALAWNEFWNDQISTHTQNTFSGGALCADRYTPDLKMRIDQIQFCSQPRKRRFIFKSIAKWPAKNKKTFANYGFLDKTKIRIAKPTHTFHSLPLAPNAAAAWILLVGEVLNSVSSFDAVMMWCSRRMHFADLKNREKSINVRDWWWMFWWWINDVLVFSVKYAEYVLQGLTTRTCWSTSNSYVCEWRKTHTLTTGRSKNHFLFQQLNRKLRLRYVNK